jgi:hypothetical protein
MDLKNESKPVGKAHESFMHPGLSAREGDKA